MMAYIDFSGKKFLFCYYFFFWGGGGGKKQTIEGEREKGKLCPGHPGGAAMGPSYDYYLFFSFSGEEKANLPSQQIIIIIIKKNQPTKQV